MTTEDVTRTPQTDDKGVPRCSYDKCPSYDGKRCRELGYEPKSVCEPEVEQVRQDVMFLADRFRERHMTECSIEPRITALVVKYARLGGFPEGSK